MARKKQQDPTVLHGHHVVTGAELRATLEAARDADETARVRRHVLHGVVLVILAGLVAAAIIAALGILNGRLLVPVAEPAEKPVSACPAGTFDYLPPESITLNVYNSTSRPGLARTVADEFLARNFAVGAVTNVAAGYRGVAAVVSGTVGHPAAFTVQRNLAGSDYFQDNRTDGSVDVILAQDYSALVPPELVDRTPGRLSCPRENRRIADDEKLPIAPSAARPATP